MIVLDFSTALAVVAGVFVFLIGFLWCSVSFAGSSGATGSLDPRFVWVCGVCTYNYVNTREEAISCCPRCGSYNKRNSS